MTTRTRTFAAIVAVCVLGCAAALVLSISNGSGGAAAKLGTGASTSAAAGARAHLPADVSLVVRAVSKKDPRLNGHLYTVDQAGRTTEVPGSPSCERIAVGGGTGLCLYLAKSGVDYRAAILDSRLHVRKVLGLTGLPSRARISPDGKLGATTTFAYGDSYAAPGQFSTRTAIIDLERGSIVGDLESWKFTRDGRAVDAADRNFWGVTFADDGDRFYATMATGGHHYLVRGSIRAKGGQTIRDNVECPSLSPDGKRIAYKYRIGGGHWRLHVYDLETGADVALAERRSIDDQPFWVDAATVAYSDGHSTWVTPGDGSGNPQILVPGADSPTALDSPL